MIIYKHSGSWFGFSSLTRVHGSAAYKAVLPSGFSTLLLYVCYELIPLHGVESGQPIARHPYVIQAFILFFSFLLTFRLNFAYSRYWESATAVHQMMSKWLDCAMCMGSFHYQSDQYLDIKPPTFAGLDEDVTSERITGRKRDFRGPSKEEAFRSLRKVVGGTSGLSSRSRWKILGRRRRRDDASSHSLDDRHSDLGKSINSKRQGRDADSSRKTIPIPVRFQEQFYGTAESSDNEEDHRGGVPRQGLARDDQGYRNVAVRARIPKPSLFLQETAHLISLLCAVALSTLRNDIDQAASPVTTYFPGMPWPCVDPDALEKEIKEEYEESNAFWRWIYFCLGLSRSQKRRTLYNAARPFGVLGGVSDEEIDLLQRARGPYAKVALCTMWLQEFISREYMAGSTGSVAPPIISRLYQFVSDGVLGYNQARKVAYVPFPFPHGQITAFFSLSIIFIFPMLYGSFVTILWFSCIMNYFTVLCFLGLHEVARELENPFQNVPNDLPLTTFQAEMNEALVTMYAGYSPDAWFEVAPSTSELPDVRELP